MSVPIRNIQPPDYRGYFLRGWDQGSGIDPDAGTRTDRGDGTTGDEVGTIQADEFESHRHRYYGDDDDSGSGNIGWATAGGSSHDFFYWTNDTGGSETRPININVLYCIKSTDGSGGGGESFPPCPDGNILVYSGGVWTCSAPPGGSGLRTDCADDQFLQWNGSDWNCSDVSGGAGSCSVTNIQKYSHSETNAQSTISIGTHDFCAQTGMHSGTDDSCEVTLSSGTWRLRAESNNANQVWCYATCFDLDCTGGGGGITDVNGGAGLLPDSCTGPTCTLDVNTGTSSVTGLEIDAATDTLRLWDDNCAVGDVLKKTATGWDCVADATGSGGVTSITGTNGITASASTGAVTLSSNANYLQRRVVNTCAANEAIQSISSTGAVICVTVQPIPCTYSGTTYSAGAQCQISRELVWPSSVDQTYQICQSDGTWLVQHCFGLASSDCLTMSSC